MAVYTVHQPPLRAADASPDPARFVFVRDGFSLWAFLLAPLWMLWHRMWLVLAGYVVVSVGLGTLVKAFAATATVTVGIGLLISLLVGLEAGTLRRFAMSRRGWKNIGVVSGDDREHAERRFFDAWVGKATSQRGAPAASSAPIPPSAPTSPSPRLPRAPDIIGLFPEPGAPR